MAKFYPPQLEGTLPAFDDNDVIWVPFTMSPLVSKNEVKAFIAKYKKLSDNSTTIYTSTKSEQFKINSDGRTGEARFWVGSGYIPKNEYYKVQIAYVDKTDTIGVYSNAAIIKHCNTPTLDVVELEQNPGCIYKYYTGRYRIKDDPTEKVYKYRFTLETWEKAQWVTRYTTGWQLHNFDSDEYDVTKNTYTSYDIFPLNIDLPKGKKCQLTYEVITSNQLQKSKVYNFDYSEMQTSRFFNNDLLEATLNSDEGYVALNFIPATGLKGNFKLVRLETNSISQSWKELCYFSGNGNKYDAIYYYYDYDIEQGKTYQYAIQEENANGLVVQKGLNKLVSVDFNDMFLFDGNKQLKVQFNPKVSSIKPIRQEAKQDTIGGQFPYIFRNGNVDYKEFSISGLISKQSDPEENFINALTIITPQMDFLKQMTQFVIDGGSEKGKTYDYLNKSRMAKMTLNNTPNRSDYQKKLDAIYNYFILERENAIPELVDKLMIIAEGAGYWENSEIDSFYNLIQGLNTQNINIFNSNLTDYNIKVERDFREKVLEWLTDGVPKLFKSPTEGNHIVRLMNVSLSPIDTLGRMLYTFTATAYEIAEYNYENLIKYNFINSDNLISLKNLQYKQSSHSNSAVYGRRAMPVAQTEEQTATWGDNLLNEQDIVSVQISVSNGTKFLINDGMQRTEYETQDDGSVIANTVPGFEVYVTNTYNITATEGNSILEVRPQADYTGTINLIYGYNTNIYNQTDLIKGYSFKTSELLVFDYDTYKDTNIIDLFNNSKINITKIAFLRCQGSGKLILDETEQEYFDLSTTGFLELKNIDNIKTLKMIDSDKEDMRLEVIFNYCVYDYIYDTQDETVSSWYQCLLDDFNEQYNDIYSIEDENQEINYNFGLIEKNRNGSELEGVYYRYIRALERKITEFNANLLKGQGLGED